MKNNCIFIRNDDVRETLDKELIEITSLCIKVNVPISHTVEPANVSKEVVDWLLETKKKHPGLIEIFQHGYSHKLNYQRVVGGKIKKGEFGGSRTYAEQFDAIKRGKELLDKYFRDNWFPLFTFPYGARNNAALKAVSDAGFKVVNGSMGVSLQHRILYTIGRTLNREMLFGRKISYNLRHRKNLNLFQIDTSISVIKKYLDEGTEASFYSLDELKAKTTAYLNNSPTFGIVLHHRYHNTEAKIKLLEDYILWLKTMPDVEFVTQEYIYHKFAKK
jgi:peptidoglycan/xylan/chitin deacetylase (PgdA/CDA1 family)